MRHPIAKLALCLALSLILFLFLAEVLSSTGSTGDLNYDVILSGAGAAPEQGRAAPYGQWIITHNAAGITTTENYGTVARTAGYDWYKVIYCENTGSAAATLNLYARTTSTGNLYTLQFPVGSVSASSRTYISVTNMAPWLTLGITSTTATTMTCGIYVQTP